MARDGVDISAFNQTDHTTCDHTVVFVAVDGAPAAMIVVADRVTPTSVSAIKVLHNHG